MGNDIRAWYIHTITQAIQGLYFSARQMRATMSRERWIGHLMAWSSFLILVGGNPTNFLSPEDEQILRQEQKD